MLVTVYVEPVCCTLPSGSNGVGAAYSCSSGKSSTRVNDVPHPVTEPVLLVMTRLLKSEPLIMVPDGVAYCAVERYRAAAVGEGATIGIVAFEVERHRRSG